MEYGVRFNNKNTTEYVGGAGLTFEALSLEQAIEDVKLYNAIANTLEGAAWADTVVVARETPEDEWVEMELP